MPSMICSKCGSSETVSDLYYKNYIESGIPLSEYVCDECEKEEVNEAGQEASKKEWR